MNHLLALIAGCVKHSALVMVLVKYFSTEGIKARALQLRKMADDALDDSKPKGAISPEITSRKVT